MSSFAAILDLSSLDGTNGFRVRGQSSQELTGGSVASAGDINGDGYDDIIVGAGGVTSTGLGTGAGYVVFGRAGGFGATIAPSSLSGANGFRALGVASIDQTGYSVASAGDVNGDGLDDLIIGACGVDVNGANSGAAYVVFGSTSPFSANFLLSALDGDNGFRINGVAAGDAFGLEVASAGDVNGDGLADLIVGSAIAGADDAGAAYVLFGNAGGFAANVELSALDGSDGFRISGGSASDRLGISAASAGDINGDGVDDLIVGASTADSNGSDAGASYVVFGGVTSFGANLDVTTLNGSNGFQIIGAAAGEQSGRSVASAGDFNGDGLGDLIIGAASANGQSLGSGASYLLFGRASGFGASVDLSSLTGADGFRIDGAATGDRFGRSVASAGDINGDGLGDLIIGAPGADTNGNQSGGSYVVFGRATSPGSNLDLATLDGTGGFLIRGAAAGDYSGRSVASAGDVNGDGIDDLIIGAHQADPAGDNSGAAYVIFGRAYQFNFAGTSGVDESRGGMLDDVLSGLGGNDLLRGQGGDDLLDGGDGKDALYGGAGSDDLVGGSGGDLLDGGTGADQMAGGLGDDTYVIDDLGDVITEAAGEGQDRVRSSIEFTLSATLENLQLIGSAHIDGSGNALANQIDGNSGDNAISGNGGNDLIRGAGGADILSGDEGNDQVLGGDGNDMLYGAAGLDRLQGEAGADQLQGGDGADILDGGADNDVLYGEQGADQLNGGDGDDRLLGGDGNDVLTGGAGLDELSGGAGDDIYVVKAGDVVGESAGEGVDMVRSAGDWVLGEHFERLVLEGSGNIQGVGNALANQITGNGGANTLDGAAGNDNINGGLGADRIIGGTGNDILAGGGGIDTFVVRPESVYSSSSPQGRVLEVDTIADYQIGVDVIDLSAITSGDADGAFNLVSNFDGVAGRMTLKFAGGTTSLSLDIDGDSKADYMIRINGDVTGESGRWLL